MPHAEHGHPDSEFLRTPTDQWLQLIDEHIITIKETEEPPEFELVMDIMHEETKQHWRQSVSFSRVQMVNHLKMLTAACKRAGLEIPG